MSKKKVIKLPYNFKPRSYQLPLLVSLDKGVKRAVAIWHRRSGKDLTLINHMTKCMYQRVGAYQYVFPTYKQAKKVIWNGMTRDGVKFLDYIPEQLRKRVDNTEMFIEMSNGSTFQLIGSDNIDSIVGSNPIGMIFSEWALQDPTAWDYMRPVLAENGGWAVFPYTPRGRNHGYTTLQIAESFPEQWYSEVLTVEDTQAIKPEVLEQERAEIIAKHGNDALYQQEYMCDFNVPIQGAYYADQLMKARTEGRISGVPYEPETVVHTAWDLGVDDSMSIWMYQVVGREIHFIDYYESSGEGLVHYIKVLKNKEYVYGTHYAPHDIRVRELTTGKSRLETAEKLGIKFETAPRLPIEDGIEAGRNILNRCWFDETKCERGLSALNSYHKIWDEENKVFRMRPHHDWSSHGADAFRTFATGHTEVQTEHEEAVEEEVIVDPYDEPFDV